MPGGSTRGNCMHSIFPEAESGFFLFHNCMYLFLERGIGRDKERERNIDWLPLMCTLARN